MNPFAEMYEREIREMGTDRLRGDVKQMVFLDGTYHEGVGWWLEIPTTTLQQFGAARG